MCSKEERKILVCVIIKKGAYLTWRSANTQRLIFLAVASAAGTTQNEVDNNEHGISPGYTNPAHFRAAPLSAGLLFVRHYLIVSDLNSMQIKIVF